MKSVQNVVACKFGGSSLCSAEMFRKVAEIVKPDHHRRFIIPSAPGKRHDGDSKITDLLLNAHGGVRMAWQEVRSRFEQLANELGLSGILNTHLD